MTIAVDAVVNPRKMRLRELVYWSRIPVRAAKCAGTEPRMNGEVAQCLRLGHLRHRATGILASDSPTALRASSLL